MKVLRTAVLAIGAAGVLLAGGPANATGPVVVQGESASSYSTGCGDGGDASDMGPLSYGGTSTMFFPASGCNASYTSSGAVTVTGARVMLSGVAGTLCGRLTVSGTTSSDKDFCETNDTWVTISFSTAALTASGSFTATWTTASGTPSYVNLFVDYFTGIG